MDAVREEIMIGRAAAELIYLGVGAVERPCICRKQVLYVQSSSSEKYFEMPSPPRRSSHDTFGTRVISWNGPVCHEQLYKHLYPIRRTVVRQGGHGMIEFQRETSRSGLVFARSIRQVSTDTIQKFVSNKSV